MLRVNLSKNYLDIFVFPSLIYLTCTFTNIFHIYIYIYIYIGLFHLGCGQICCPETHVVGSRPTLWAVGQLPASQVVCFSVKITLEQDHNGCNAYSSIHTKLGTKF